MSIMNIAYYLSRGVALAPYYKDGIIMNDNYIVFDNLVQANADIAGEFLPVKARKESPSGEPYRLGGLKDVTARATAAGERFRLYNLSHPD